MTLPDKGTPVGAQRRGEASIQDAIPDFPTSHRADATGRIRSPTPGFDGRGLPVAGGLTQEVGPHPSQIDGKPSGVE